ncbi:MAG: peptidylprolyl isomerase [Bacteroidaceae bacterium]|nr:peptidylprolyl isomerase [Bacteroidaceae bacterium]
MRKLGYLLLSVLLLASCGKKKEGTEVLIETSMGDIRAVLFDDTPLHRDNFIKLAHEGYFDEMMWHRIVPGLMIQTGDPTLKPANRPVTVDTSALHYTIPQEIRFPKYIHRRGMLAAARQPDNLNPKKESSSTQWYIVTGEKYTPTSLADFYQTLYQEAVNTKWRRLQDKNAKRLDILESSNKDAYYELQDSILNVAEAEVANRPPRPFNEQQKRVYTTEGGCPHLDGEYTIFGQVTEGMNVVEKIVNVPTDERERPMREVYIKRVIVLD